MNPVGQERRTPWGGDKCIPEMTILNVIESGPTATELFSLCYVPDSFVRVSVDKAT